MRFVRAIRVWVVGNRRLKFHAMKFHEISPPSPRFHEIDMDFTPATARADPESALTTLSRPRGRHVVGTRKPRVAARPSDVERHTGMDFEAGHVHRARNVEEQPPGGMITGSMCPR